jgi:hypothetical protein
MAAVGLIINERSNRSASVLDEILHVARRFADVRTEVLDGVRGLDRALIGMNRKRVDTLILAGGDGTMQATFTDAINNRRFEHEPRFVALPCGMTNVIANDCGLRGAPAPSLDAFLKRREAGSVVATRRTLLSVAAAGQDPVHGFFLGAGAFHSAVKFSRERIQSAGAKRSVALALTVGSYILKQAANPAAAESIALEFKEGASTGARAREPLTLFLATTLSKLGSGIYPFWGKGEGAIAATTVAHPARRSLRAAPSVLRGKCAPWFEDFGYRSWRAGRMVARFAAPFVFDGEIYRSDGTRDVVFGTTHNVDFLN